MSGEGYDEGDWANPSLLAADDLQACASLGDELTIVGAEGFGEGGLELAVEDQRTRVSAKSPTGKE